MFLAGDVGGTKTVLGLFRRERGRLVALREATYPSADFASFEAILDAFLAAGRGRPRAAAVGVAGPVVSGRSRVVNLRWPVDRSRIARRLELAASRVEVLNDLEANAWGIAELPARRLASLTPGLRGSPGNAALIAAGTGLGMAILVRDGERFVPSASEGGHQSFAPRDELEIELLRSLSVLHGRVSVERVLSGPGLSAIWRFLVEREGGAIPERMRARLRDADDDNAAIAEAALAGEDATAGRALDRFVSLYGAAAGDLALVARATAGLYVGGGIAPKILPRLRTGGFLAAFRAKGRLSPLLDGIPVKVILEPRTALYGAAARAERAAAAKHKR